MDKNYLNYWWGRFLRSPKQYRLVPLLLDATRTRWLVPIAKKKIPYTSVAGHKEIKLGGPENSSLLTGFHGVGRGHTVHWRGNLIKGTELCMLQYQPARQDVPTGTMVAQQLWVQATAFGLDIKSIP